MLLKAADLLAGPWRQRLNAATMLGQSKTAFQAEIDAACELIDEVWRVVRQWRVYLTEAGVPAAEQDKIASAFRHIDDVSTAALRKLLP